MTEFFCIFPQALKKCLIPSTNNYLPKYHAMKTYMGCRSKASRITDLQVNSRLHVLTYLYKGGMLLVTVVSEAVWNPRDHWVLDVYDIKR
jgi:hypothetical protein